MKYNSIKTNKFKLKIKLFKKYKWVYLKYKQNKYQIFYKPNIDQQHKG